MQRVIVEIEPDVWVYTDNDASDEEIRKNAAEAVNEEKWYPNEMNIVGYEGTKQ